MRWILTGDEFDAREALRIGLVQELAPVGQELDRAIAIAETIAKQAPLAVQATLHNARVAFTGGEEQALAELMPTLQRLMATEDAQEGMMSFIERRDAVYRGK